MMRSFDYVVNRVLGTGEHDTALRPADAERLRPWAHVWHAWTAGSFLREYFKEEGVTRLLPSSPERRTWLLEICAIEKLLGEIRSEPNRRPEWIGVPLRGLLALLGNKS